jgi:hypothetical protein
VILRKKKKKWHVRLALKFEFFKSPLDLYNQKKILSILKCVVWLIYISEHVVIRKKLFFKTKGEKIEGCASWWREI